MDHAFYPFVDNMSEDASRGDEKSQESKQKETTAQGELGAVRYPARIAIYDDAAAAPRVVVIEPTDIRSYLEEITATVNRLAHEQGSQIPFTVIREIVENFIHAYFIAPTITILDGGNTLRFSDQGPGIQEKDLAMEYGTTSATEEMKHYIRGVGSGLPYVQQYMTDKGVMLIGHEALTDTMKDIIVDAISAAAISIIGFFSICKKNKPAPADKAA